MKKTLTLIALVGLVLLFTTTKDTSLIAFGDFYSPMGKTPTIPILPPIM